MRSPSVVAIVLHGAGPYYLEPLIRAGRLPHLAALRQQGSERRILSPYPVAAGAWVTMLTGLGVGSHGVIDYIDFDARRYHPASGALTDPARYRDDTLFAALGRHQRTVASLYLPMTYPPWPVNGVMVSGFPLPDERRPPTWPPGLSATLPPLNERRLATIRYERPDLVDRYLRFHLPRIEGLALEIIRGGRHDVVLACLALPDVAHHYFWRRDDESAIERINQVYELVDGAIGRLAAAVPADAHLVVLSDHGGGPAPSRVFNVNRWLADEGFLAFRARNGRAPAAAPLVNRAVRWARRMRLNQRLSPLLGADLRDRLSALSQNDAFVEWGRTAAYGMSFFYPLAGIEVNLRGRQASGVADTRDRAPLLARLTTALESLRDPATNRPVCRRVLPREEMFRGPHLDRFPDLVAVLDEDYEARGQHASNVFEPNVLQWEYPYMGYHHREGIFLVHGPGAEAGRTFAAAEMADVMPTLLDLAGVPVPPAVQGRVLER